MQFPGSLSQSVSPAVYGTPALGRSAGLGGVEEGGAVAVRAGTRTVLLKT